MDLNFQKIADTILLKDTFQNTLGMKPIGLANKSYNFMRHTLLRNIGSGQNDYDGYATPIGSLPQIGSTMYHGWFFRDKLKRVTNDYLTYVDTFGKANLDRNFNTQYSKLATFQDYSLNLDNNKVNAVRGYVINNTKEVNEDILDNINDTRLANIGEFYRYHTLSNTYGYLKNFISYASPTDSDGTNAITNKNGITQGAYAMFGFDGRYGISDATELETNKVRDISSYLGDIIAWSTADHTYDSTSSPGTQSYTGWVKTIVGSSNVNNDSTISLEYGDVSQGTRQQGSQHLYYPFGNFYSMTYSLGLYSASADNTKKLILKSMLGYNLLDTTKDNDLKLEYNTDYSNLSRNKYYVGLGTRGTNYLDKITNTNVEFIKDTTDDTAVIRYIPIDAGNDNLWSAKALFAYSEADGKVTSNNVSPTLSTSPTTFNDGVNIGRYTAYDNKGLVNKDDIISYTNERFLYGKYGTLLARFHGNGFDNATDARANRDFIETAISKYGVSHGRNLLKKTPTKVNGYDNPYCRVWTYHHQYKAMEDTIRPLRTSDNGSNSLVGTDIAKGRVGQERLEKYGVKTTKSHTVRYAPTNKDNIKNVMFSLENLAWKNNKELNEVNRGPNGGRIMWFPPYNLKFSENIGVDWNSSAFIGRGEKIYTYANTDRSGTLDFSILIDHPNVINKWRGLSGGQMIGDVDDIESSEQTLLRFFAGCEVLQGSPSTSKKGQGNTKDVKGADSTTVTSNGDDKIIFYVFFPNNYSGVDDINSQNVDPMWYLMNGFGAQKGYSGNTQQLIDIPTSKVKRGTFNIGYEVSNAVPISVTATKTTNGKFHDEDVYANYDNKKNNYILGEVSENSLKVQYATQKALQKGSTNKYNYWAYRCDEAYEDQVLNISPTSYSKEDKKTNSSNYADLRCYGLNSMLYKEADKQTDFEVNISTNPFVTNYLTIDSKNADKLYSLVDVFSVLEDTKLLTTYTHEEEMVLLSELFTQYNVTNVKIDGYASKDGYTSSNSTLAANRAKTVWNWMQKSTLGKKYFGGIEENKGLTLSVASHGEIGKDTIHDNNAIDYKMARRVRVEITLSKTKVTEPTSPSSSNSEEFTVNDNINVCDNQIGRVIKDVLKSASTLSNQGSMKTAFTNNAFANDVAKNAYEKTLRKIDQNKVEDERVKTSQETLGYNGYENEYEYFKDLELNEPFLHNKLVDKIKYFDPAFHSITPEGFNARLTFLHQCTRQGSTRGASSTDIVNASNLAFGAPPICVLRVGDFYNTRILIESLSINYDNVSWDLNDEGIGVMPMMANISIGFKFLGGSDIEGPIRRLQNAVSFNYYANTSIYDGRATISDGYDAKRDGVTHDTTSEIPITMENMDDELK